MPTLAEQRIPKVVRKGATFLSLSLTGLTSQPRDPPESRPRLHWPQGCCGASPAPFPVSSCPLVSGTRDSELSWVRRPRDRLSSRPPNTQHLVSTQAPPQAPGAPPCRDPRGGEVRGHLGPNPEATNSLLCGLGQLMFPLHASVSPAVHGSLGESEQIIHGSVPGKRVWEGDGPSGPGPRGPQFLRVRGP